MSKEINNFTRPVAPASLESQGFRSFDIVNADYVELPNCLTVEEVRLNGRVIPEFHEQQVPTDTTHTRFETHRVRMYMLDADAAGHPALMRSQSSNDGKWQVGAKLHVRGTWADQKPAAKPAKEADKKPETSDKKPESAKPKICNRRITAKGS